MKLFARGLFLVLLILISAYFLFVGIGPVAGVGFLTLVLWIVMRVESYWIRRVNAFDIQKYPGLKMTLQRVREQTAPHLRRIPEGREFKMMIFPDPIPHAFLIRAWGSAPLLFMSQGALATLSEAHLRSLIEKARSGPHLRGLKFRSLCATVADQLIRKTPGDWAIYLYGEGGGSTPKSATAIQFLGASVFYPWIRLALAMGKSDAAPTGYLGGAWGSAAPVATRQLAL